MPRQWQTMPYPFGTGLATKHDTRARPAPALDICRDVEFDDIGGLRVRRPFVSLSNQIIGGGTLANCRRVVENDGELLVFTSDALYSWVPAQSKWSLRGTHLAVAVDERPAIVTPGDQIDGDLAELAGTIVYAWTEGTQVYASAVDSATGAVVVTQTAVSTAVGRPRLVALATKILLFVDAGSSNLTVRAIDPASPSAGIAGAGTTVAAGVYNQNYDVVKVDGQDLAIGAYRRSTTTSYTAFTVTPALVVTSSTKARTCDGPIAIATSGSGGTQTQVVRGNGTNVQGDLLTTSTLADVFTGQAIGTAASTTINQIAVAFSSSTSARAFWTSGASGETASFTNFEVKTNTVTTSNVVGTQGSFRQQLGIASRAFAHGGAVYVWLAFGSDSGTSVAGNASAVRAQLQNAYYLYRDDQLLVSRAVMNSGGGFAASTGRLPSVTLSSGSTYAWCATRRRRIELGAIAEHTGFGSRSPEHVAFTFDDDRARRTARIGQTLYVAGGIPLQYDGVQLAEVGFLVYPWYFEPQLAGAGTLSAGTYTWLSTMRWTNARGEVDRSTTATGMSLTLAASKFAFLNYKNLHVTMKTGARPANHDMWRAPVNAPPGSPYYLVTSQDPNAALAPNGYVANNDLVQSSTPGADDFSDAVLITKEQYPEVGSVLEYMAPPGATVIAATDTRVYLGGVSGDPDRIWYSRLRADGEVASFHDGNTADVPPAGGDITAIALLNDTLVVFRERAVYALGGDGYDNTGGGQNYGPARLLSSDLGAVSAESVALGPMGLIFKSRKGWYVLGGGWDLEYVGGPVAAFDAEAVRSMHIVEGQHQVRILTSARMLVWDYLVNQWCEWTITGGVHGALWSGSHVYLTSTGPQQQQATIGSAAVGYDIETAWIKLADLQGDGLARWFGVLGELLSAHLVRVRVARDYQYTSGLPAYVDDVAWDPTLAPTAAIGSAMQLRHAPSVQRMEALKVRLTAASVASVASGSTLAAPEVLVTAGTPWAATWAPVLLGELGNAVVLSVACVTATGEPTIVVLDHRVWDIADHRWREQANTVGVVITGSGSGPTIGQLEAAIVANTKLITLTTPDPTPSKVIDILSNEGVTTDVPFVGGAFGTPTGELARLTGLAVDVSVMPGLYRRLAAAQKA